jgi:hypothetical protein
MANLIRTSKSGSSWTRNDLLSYNIFVENIGEEKFFDMKVGDTSLSIDDDIVNFDLSDNRDDLPKKSRKLLGYLDIAAKSTEESAVDDFAKELLSTMDFDIRDRIIRTRHAISLLICGEYRMAQADICIIREKKDLMIMVQVVSSKNPEPQVIAEAIAAFQENNEEREKTGKTRLDRMAIPCITMIGTSPVFYIVPVTEDLSTFVIAGQYPDKQTVVLKHIPKIPRRASDAMVSKDNRKKILQCFEAFKKFVDDLEEQLEK